MPDNSAIVKETSVNLSLGEFFFKFMKKWERNIAQCNAYTGYQETYGVLLKKCMRTALKLQQIGITEDDVVAVCSPNDENACVPFVAAQFLGAKSTALHSCLSRNNIVHILKTVQPKIIFVSNDAVQLIEVCLSVAGVQCLVETFTGRMHEEISECEKALEEEGDFKPVRRDEMETAVISFTSGSTGHPKGACINHYSLLTGKHDPNGTFYYIPTLVYSSLYWISGIQLLIMCVGCGSPRVLCSSFEPTRTSYLAEIYQVKLLSGTSSQIRNIINAWPDDFEVSSLETILVYGEEVTYKLLEDIFSKLPITVSVLNIYGQSELGGGCFNSEAVKYEDVSQRNPRALSCGKMRPDFDWKIVDPLTRQILGPHQRGELLLKAKSVMNGYYKTDSSSCFDTDGYLKTGDVFYHDEDQYMYYEGRLKSVFKYRGWQVSPTVIEDVLVNHSSVEDAIVIDVPHEMDGSHPTGFVKIKEGHGGVTPEEVEDFANEKLGDHEKLRGGVVFIQEIPYTVTGKKNRVMLREQVLNGLGTCKLSSI